MGCMRENNYKLKEYYIYGLKVIPASFCENFIRSRWNTSP